MAFSAFLLIIILRPTSQNPSCYPVDRITGKGHNKFTNDLKKIVSVMMNWLFDLDRSIDGEAPDFGGETSHTQT